MDDVAVCLYHGSPPRLWGQRPSSKPNRMRTTVHPHACGDNPHVKLDGKPADGSPPRLWGQPPDRSTSDSPDGGSPPRLWGQRLRRKLCFVFRSGSPPRLWGQRWWHTFKPGKYAVHPHACGDNKRFNCSFCCEYRFTPTPVGTTIALPPSVPKRAVHPHACGDNRNLSLFLKC